ncbi:hypothetical protein BLA24064_03427 [Burkholderia latens]|uniref:Uncharacterized protein n=1 Tax=Burkholderia latens TaxID=488446 RepID=A0A6P2M3U0_9BURK|nr:hypothetical protein BLA24064_03427 [Burkholderia latens]
MLRRVDAGHVVEPRLQHRLAVNRRRHDAAVGDPAIRIDAARLRVDLFRLAGQAVVGLRFGGLVGPRGPFVGRVDPVRRDLDERRRLVDRRLACIRIGREPRMRGLARCRARPPGIGVRIVRRAVRRAPAAVSVRIDFDVDRLHRLDRRISMGERTRHRLAALREHHRRVAGIGRFGYVQIEPRSDIGIVSRHRDRVVERIQLQRTGAAHRVRCDRRDHGHLQLVRELLRERVAAGTEIAARQQHTVAFRVSRIVEQCTRELPRRHRLAALRDGSRAVQAHVARLRAVRLGDVEAGHLQELAGGRVTQQVHDARTRHGPQLERIDPDGLRAARRELAVHVGLDLEAREPAIRIGHRAVPSGRVVVAEPAEHRRLDQVREFLQQRGIGAAARPVERDRRTGRIAFPCERFQRMRHLQRAGGTIAARIDDRPAFRQHPPHVHADRHAHVARRRAAAPLVRHRTRRDAAPVDRMRALVDHRQRRREPVGARPAADRMVRHAVAAGRTGFDQDAARIAGIGRAAGAIARRTPRDEAACAVHVDTQHVREQLRERAHARAGAARIQDDRRLAVPAALANHLGHVVDAHRLAVRARERVGPRVRIHREVPGRDRHQRPLARRQPVLGLGRVVRIDREIGLAARIRGPLRFAHAERRVDHVDAPAVLAADQRLLRIEAARVHHA